MLTQIKNAKFYLQAKLGLSQRGAEMVEYAIVLACIAAVAAAFYASSTENNATGKNTLGSILNDLWGKVLSKASAL